MTSHFCQMTSHFGHFFYHHDYSFFLKTAMTSHYHPIMTGHYHSIITRVVFLYKANYKSSPIQVLFFLVVPCNILRPLAVFWTWTNQYWSCDKTGVEEQSLDRPDPQYKGEAGEVSHDQHRFVCVQNAARGLRILCRSPRKNSTIN